MAVHQGLSATPPPWKPYDRWKGEEFQIFYVRSTHRALLAIDKGLVEAQHFALEPIMELPWRPLPWGEILEGASNYRIVEVELPASVAQSLLRWEKLDGIGPARYGELHQLQNAVVRPLR